MTSVLLVEPESVFRTALLGALQTRGSRVEVCDDVLHALSCIDAFAPDVIALSLAHDAADRGAATQAGLDEASVCRVLERRAAKARVFRIGEVAVHEALPMRGLFVPRVAGPDAVAAALLGAPGPGIDSLAFQCDVGPAQLGPLLFWLGEQHATGTLTLLGEGQERELALVRGVPVHARSTLPAERLGAIAIKHGALSSEQLESALSHARVRGIRLGRALLDLKLVEGAALFALRARQTLEQLELACASGPYKARFRSDSGLVDTLDLYPVHPMTALLGAAARLPAAVLSSALDRAAGRAVAEAAVRGPVERWLKHLGASFDAEAPALGALRASLAQELEPASGKADAVVLALIASGAVRLGEQRSSGGTPSLPPPVGMSVSLLRALELRAAFRPPIADALPIAAPTGSLERALQAALHEDTTASLGDARARALEGPALEPLPPPLRALYAAHKASGDALGLLGVGVGADRARIELALCARLDALDAACAGAEGSALNAHVQLRKLELRRGYDRAHELLLRDAPPSKLSAAASGDAAAVIPPSPPARSSVVHGERASVMGAFGDLEPLVEQGRWTELAARIEQKHPTGAEMPPGVALLYAIALKEAPPTQARAPQIALADRAAVRAVSELFGLREDSATALLVAKRTLRKRPLEWQKEPPKRISIMLMVAALIVGAGVGLLLSHQSGIVWPF